MKASPNREEITTFLKEVKQTITNETAEYDTWVLVPRPKNISALARLGFVYSDVKDTLLSLSVSNYCEGPAHDVNEKGDCWIFGKNILGEEVYIKIKLAKFGTINPLRVVRVISFHIADSSLCYPFLE